MKCEDLSQLIRKQADAQGCEGPDAGYLQTPSHDPLGLLLPTKTKPNSLLLILTRSLIVVHILLPAHNIAARGPQDLKAQYKTGTPHKRPGTTSATTMSTSAKQTPHNNSIAALQNLDLDPGTPKIIQSSARSTSKLVES